MTNNSVTLEQLNSMIDRLIEADGVIDDVENQRKALLEQAFDCLLYTSDAADE